MISVSLGPHYITLKQTNPGEPDRYLLISEDEAQELEQPLHTARQKMHARTIQTVAERFEEPEKWDPEANMRRIGAKRVEEHPSQKLIQEALARKECDEK